jgi:hypothetical protein
VAFYVTPSVSVRAIDPAANSTYLNPADAVLAWYHRLYQV